MTHTENRQPEKAKEKRRLSIITAVLMIVVIILVWLLLQRCDSIPGGGPGVPTATLAPGATRDPFDPNVKPGPWEGKTPEEIAKDFQASIDESMFNVSINPRVVLKKGADEADIRIENIPANTRLMKVRIVLKDNNLLLYQSGLIPPGFHIQTTKFEQVLKKGEYNALAIFTAHDPETQVQNGTVNVEMKIVVEK